MRASREPVIVPRDRAERPEALPHLMSGSKQDTETVHAFFQDMRACGLGDPIIVASVVRRVPSVNASRVRADRALPSRLEHAPPAPYKTGFGFIPPCLRPKPPHPPSGHYGCAKSRTTPSTSFHVVPVNPIAQASIESLQTPTRSQSCACSSSIQVRHPTS